MSLTQEIVNNYNKLKADYAEIFKKFIEMEDEKREHTLVLKNIEGLSKERRCWRMIGGVLVEKTMEEVLTGLSESIKMYETAIKALETALKKKEKDILEIEMKYNVNPNKKAGQQATPAASTSDKTQGVLA
jgi:prefoldin subunit 2